MGRHANNKVWEYFDYISDKMAKCRSCKAVLSTPSKSRGNMVRHLFTLHGINMYTAGQNRGKVLEDIPSRRGREFHEALGNGEQNVFRRFANRISMDSNSLDIQYNTESSLTQAEDDNSRYDYNASQHDDDNDIQVINVVESTTLKNPVVNTESQEFQKKEKHVDGLEAYEQDHNEELNMSLSDPLINLNVEPPELRTACSTSDIDNHHTHNSQPCFSTSHPLPKKNGSTSQNHLESLQAEALTEKLKAEARYFNELAELTRSKRIFIDLQTRKLRNEIQIQLNNKRNEN